MPHFDPNKLLELLNQKQDKYTDKELRVLEKAFEDTLNSVTLSDAAEAYDESEDFLAALYTKVTGSVLDIEFDPDAEEAEVHRQQEIIEARSGDGLSEYQEE